MKTSDRLDTRAEAMAVVKKANQDLDKLKTEVEDKLAVMESLRQWLSKFESTSWMFFAMKSPVEYYSLCYHSGTKQWYVRRRVWPGSSNADLHFKSEWSTQPLSQDRIDMPYGMRFLKRMSLKGLIESMVEISHEEGYPFSEQDLALYQNYKVSNKQVDMVVNTDLR